MDRWENGFEEGEGFEAGYASDDGGRDEPAGYEGDELAVRRGVGDDAVRGPQAALRDRERLRLFAAGMSLLLGEMVSAVGARARRGEDVLEEIAA